MNWKYVAAAFAVIIGWNLFLIQRDAKLMNAYEACQYNHPSCPYNK